MISNVTINGKEVAIPKDFFEVGVKASFNENIQANLTTEEFTFILDAYEEIVNWIKDGRQGGLGIFEGIPITIQKSSGKANISTFKGIIDLQDGTTIQENLKQVRARLRQDDNLNQLSELLEPLDYGYLRDIGVITSSDYVKVDYIVNKIDKGVETITLLITIYLLSKQLADTIRDLASSIATISGIAGAVPGGPIGAAIYATAIAIVQIAYAIALIVLIIDFGTDLLNIVVQPLRTHRGIPLKTLLSKACEHIGYRLETTVEDLDNLVYLPSNINVDEFSQKSIIRKPGAITEGIPNARDFGYTCSDLFQAARDLFNARFAIANNTVQFHTESSPYWINQSGWVKPNLIKNRADQEYRYNTEDLRASIFIQFLTDIADEYTIKNYKGTSYQVLTDASVVGEQTNKTIKGLDRVSLPFALGNRKDSLNSFEKALLPLANLFDKLGGLFGGSPGLAKKIKTKVGVLEVGDNNHSIPKLLWMNGSRMPKAHRELFSAKTLWEKYHVEKSFVNNGGNRQRRIVANEVIPFGLSDFVTLLNNSYFRDENGTVGKVLEIEWAMNKDEAVISYWVQEAYTNNLKETFIEQS